MMNTCDSPICEADGEDYITMTKPGEERSFCDLHCLSEWLIVEAGMSYELAKHSVEQHFSKNDA